MKKLLLTIIVLFVFVLPFQNWTGLSFKEQKEKDIQAKIAYLQEKYPPDETEWMHEISKDIN